MIHHIRRSILDMLATAQSMRYGELKPTSLDGNVFNYHLKGLITDSFVHKNADGNYSLTQQGRDYIVHRHEDITQSAHSIYLIVLKRGDTYLLRRRSVQPMLGYAGFIHGEPIAGVNIVGSAVERLHNKTGIQNVTLSVIGSALISQYVDEELQSFSNAIILYGETQQDIYIENDETGENFWAELEADEKTLPSCKDIVEMISNQQAWLDRSYQIV
jgi:hypothetical protein